MANYNNVPVLSKIKIGDSYYYLKDADARTLLTSVEGRVGVIEADYLVGADKTELAGLISAEQERAEGAEAQVLVDAKAYTDEKIGDIVLIKYEVVTALPTADADHEFNKSKTIYLKKEGTIGSDIYSEYICVDKGASENPRYAWEKIGDTRIDLSNYYTKSEVDGLIDGVEALVTAEQERAEGAEEALGGRIDGVAGDLADEIARAEGKEGELNTAIQGEITRATGVEGGLNTRLTTAEGEIDTLQGKVETIEGKPAYNITAQQITDWNGEIGAKAAALAEADRAIAAEEGLNNELTDLSGRVGDIEDKEDGWDAKLDNVKLGGNWVTVKSDVAGKGNYVDLGNIATTTGVLDNASYTGSTHKLVIHKGDGNNVVDHTFGDLADTNLSQIEVKGQTVDVNVDSAKVSVKEYAIADAAATSDVELSRGDYTPAGNVTVTLDQTSTAVQSTGSYTPAGSVDIDHEDVTIQSMKTTGSVASFTEGAFTPNVPTTLNLSKFNGGSVATYSHTGFSGGSLGEATKSQFAVEGLVAEVGEGTDAECLIFTAATKSNAVTEQGAYTAAVYGTDNFNGGAVASLGEGFYTVGSAASKAADNFTANVLPTFEELTASKVTGEGGFTGTAATITVNGNYDKASVKTSTFAGTKETGLKVTGGTYYKQILTESTVQKDVTIDADVTIADKNVTKKA